MSQAEQKPLQTYLEEKRESIIDEHKKYWEMSPSDPEKTEGLIDKVVHTYGLDQILGAESAEVTSVRTHRGDPYVTCPENYTGTIVIELYNGEDGSTPSAGMHFEAEIDRDENETYVTVQPGSSDSVEFQYDQPLSPSRLKGILEEDIS